MNTQKEVTIYDIANVLNIATSTVSRALKNDPVVSVKTRKKIFEVAKEMGYRTNKFARNLRTQKTHTVGVIVPRLNSYFMSTVISGMETVANTEGYNLVISQSSESFDKEVSNAHTLFNNRVDGLIVSLAYDTNNFEHFDAFLQRGVPVIFFDRVLEQNPYTNVLIDNRKAAFEATRHLVDQGCRKIINITANPVRNVYADRIKGYREAMAEYGLPVNEDEDIIITNLSQEAGADVAAQLLQRPSLPDGIFVSNDNCAVGCLIALKKAGVRIPQDVAIVGFNNDPVATVVEPNLSTINYPGHKMGVQAAQSLIDYLNGKASIASTETILLRAELVIRESSLRR